MYVWCVCMYVCMYVWCVCMYANKPRTKSNPTNLPISLAFGRQRYTLLSESSTQVLASSCPPQCTNRPRQERVREKSEGEEKREEEKREGEEKRRERRVRRREESEGEEKREGRREEWGRREERVREWVRREERRERVREKREWESERASSCPPQCTNRPREERRERVSKCESE